jgi:hypothetical protein
MLIVIPVSATDERLINDFAAVLKHFGPYPGHELLVVARPSDIIYAVTLLNKIKALFKTTDIHAFETDGDRGWPSGPNFYWNRTIHHLKDERKNKLAWLWMELDMTPLKTGWIDALQKEYKKHNKLCLGWVQNTTTVTSESKVVTIAQHLVGAAIYPPDIDVCCDIWRHVDKIKTAFDVLCQWQLVPNSHHTTLFQHCFRTQNYKQLEDGIIKGEDNNKFPIGLQFDFPLDPNAVLHHGCDDGSLARLLVEITPEKVAKKKTTSTKKK